MKKGEIIYIRAVVVRDQDGVVIANLEDGFGHAEVVIAREAVACVPPAAA